MSISRSADPPVAENGGTAFRWLTEQSVFHVVDLETTSASIPDARIIAIAVVSVPGAGARWEEYDSRVNPEAEIDPFTISVHGLTSADLVDAPKLEALAGQVVERLAGDGDGASAASAGGAFESVLVAHNARFDVSILSRELAAAGAATGASEAQGLPDLPVLDTIVLAKLLEVQTPGGNFDLTSLCSALGVERGKEHDALADARATAGVLVALLQRAARMGHTSIADLHQIAGGTRVSGYVGSTKAEQATDTVGEGSPEVDGPGPLPEKHLETHAVLLPAGRDETGLADDELRAWVEGLEECAWYGCAGLEDKAEAATEHASRLYPLVQDLLDAVLSASDATSETEAVDEPGQEVEGQEARRWAKWQVNNLLAAQMILIQYGLEPRQAVRWWQEHRDKITAAPVCDQRRRAQSPDVNIWKCYRCRNGLGCAPDMFVHAVAAAAVHAPDGNIPAGRIETLLNRSNSPLGRWASKQHGRELAAAAARLVLAQVSGGGHRGATRSSKALAYVHELELTSRDPVLALLYAVEAANQGRLLDAEIVVHSCLGSRTTDPAFEPLYQWAVGALAPRVEGQSTGYAAAGDGGAGEGAGTGPNGRAPRVWALDLTETERLQLLRRHRPVDRVYQPRFL